MFSRNTCREFFKLLRERFENKQDALNQLDMLIGDGDHGTTAARAAAAAECASRGHFKDIGSMFEAASQAVAENTGGAFGPLLGAFLAEGGQAFSSLQEADVDDMSRFLTGGLSAVQEIGGAVPGDKTLVDALAPAVAAMQAFSKLGLEAALAEAQVAAQHGAEATRQMQAAHGRSRFLGARAIGYLDAGAASMAILIAVMQAAAHGETTGEPSERPKTFSPPPGKLINHPDDMVRQDNEGLAFAYPDLVRLSPDGILLRAKPKENGKVGLAIGHGGGHTPSMGGFIGPGLLDADVYGPVFTCASGLRIARAIQYAERGAGVVLLVSNHSGDVLNARLALRRARQTGLQVEAVTLGDDIATAPRSEYLSRRGLGGLLFALKVGGAAAERGQSLTEVARLMRKTNERTATLAASVRPPTHPATGLPLFELPQGYIEVGTGVHGEAGVYRGPHMSADALVDLLVERLLADLESFDPHRLLAFINGAGGTSKMEMHILYQRLFRTLTEHGLVIEAGVVDSFFTTQEMGGFSLSLCALDDELVPYWDVPACGPAFCWPRLPRI